MRPRDSQKSKVYKAENAAFPTGSDSNSNPDLFYWECYCRKIVRSAWFRKRWPNCIVVSLKDGRGRKNASATSRGSGGTLKLPLWARVESVVLHELAHVITPKICASHGREFCRNLLELIGHYMGADASRKLKKEFDNRNVKWRKKKELSLEQREALSERGKKLAENFVAAKKKQNEE